MFLELIVVHTYLIVVSKTSCNIKYMNICLFPSLE